MTVECKNTKFEHYSKLFADCNGDQKQIYKLLDKISNKSKTGLYPEEKNDSEIANNFGSYFENKIDNTIKSINDAIQLETLTNPIDYSENESYLSEMNTFNEISQDHINKIVMQSTNKTSHLDPFPTKLIKNCLQILEKPITQIVNKSLSTGNFPSALKHAVVTPIMKDDKIGPVYENYRPISNIPLLSKIIEKAAISQYIPYLKETNKFSINNSAYKQNHSTETLLTKIHSDIIQNMDNQKITILVLLDLSAAFDSVNHNIFLNILQNRFNIKCTALKWLNSYIKNRSHMVQINNSSSKKFDLKTGVPQGTCMGPVAFLIYISALSDIAAKHNLNIQSYADDTQVYISSSPNPKDLKSKIYILEECIKEIRTFFLTHQLKLNDSKTELLIIGTHQQLSKIDIGNTFIEIGNSKIKPSSNIKNLGIIFDQTFTLDSHIKNLNQKCYYQLIKLQQLKKCIDRSTLEMVIHSFISSKIDYCNILFHNLPKYQIKKVQRIQNSAARLLTDTSKYSHITPIFKELHWLPVESRIRYKVILTTFKCLHDLAPYYLSNTLIKSNNSVRSLRSNTFNNLTKPKTKNKLGERSFHYSAPDLWNELPLFLKNESSLNIFKSKLKTFLFNKFYENS